MGSKYDDEFLEDDGKVFEFNNLEDYEALAADLEKRHLQNILDAEKNRFHSIDIEKERTRVCDKEAANKIREHQLITREAMLTANESDLALQVQKVGIAIDRLSVANRPTLDVLADALLQLELDVDPAEIAKSVRELRKTLDVKW